MALNKRVLADMGLLREVISQQQANLQQETDMEEVNTEIADGLCILADKVRVSDAVKLW